ncbi:MAG: hypothetical protein QXD67_03395 [Ignisphaera sp.]|uniref:Uncharacterized protein n=1 Tax=Ignisphaera aggregans TaxID=334771 RepID=A0A7C4H476_9CREN
MHLLLTSFYLSILTFYLGVFIYALPIPITGLKRWGPRLINDAFFIAILSTTIDSIIGFADYLRHTLGGNWTYYIHAVRGLIMYRTTLITVLSILKDYILKVVPGVSRLLSIGINILTASLYALLLMYFLALLVYYNIGVLSSLGITLMAIPFRIARSAGAFLLSFTLVLYLALPLYPNFVSILSVPLSHSFLDVTVIYGNIVTDLGYRVLEGYVGLEVENKYIGPAKLAPNGHMLLIVNKKYLDKPSTLYFDASSHRFYTNLTNIILSNLCLNRSTLNMCRIDVAVKGLLYYRKGMTIHMTPQPQFLEILEIESNSISFKVKLQSNGSLYLSIVNQYKINLISINNTINIDDLAKYRAYGWIWYNVPGNTYVIPLTPGIYTIHLKFEVSSLEGLEPSTDHLYPINIYELQPETVGDIMDILTYTSYVEVISSLLYLSLLMSTSYGLSKLLGSTTRLRLIP